MSIIFFTPLESKTKLLLVIIIFYSLLFIRSKIRDGIIDILYTDCDPQFYYAVCKEIEKNRENKILDIIVSEFTGDYQKCIKLCKSLLKLKMKPVRKAYFLQIMAKAAFEGGDFQLCSDVCKELSLLAMSKKMNKKYVHNITIRCSFYEAFINCDYDNALKQLDKCMSVSKQKNTYKAAMQYYKGLTLYYSGNFDKARVCFEEAAKAPKLKVAELSKEYIESIEAGEIKVIAQNTFDSEIEDVPSKPKDKMPMVKKIITLILFFIFLFCGFQIGNISRGPLPDVLSDDENFSVTSVAKTIHIDNDYYICIFTTDTNEIGVSYLESIGNNKYKAPVSYKTSPYTYVHYDNGYYIYLAGKTHKVYFDITDDESKIPREKKSEEFSAFGEKYYFYYSTDEKEYHFLNATGVVF